MSRQAIKYQTTAVEASKSAAEIAELVRRYGGSRFEQRWGESGDLEGIRFAIRTPDLGEVPVTLRAQTERIGEIILEAHPYTSRTRGTQQEHAEKIRAQAYRIAWRQLKDFVEQALLAVETGLFPIGAAFMAHIEVWDDVQAETVTMSEYLARRAVIEPGGSGLRLLSAGEAPRIHRLPAAGQ